MTDIPFMAIGDDELGGTLKKGDKIECPICKKHHEVKNSKDMSGKETGILLFYRCGKNSYLAGIDGKTIK